MAQALTANVTITARESSTEGDRALQDKTSINESFTFLDATGALGAPKVFSDNRTLNTTTENLDLSGALESGLGTVTVFTKVRALAVRWNGAGTLAIDTTLSNGATGVFNGTVTIGQGGVFLIIDPTAAGRAVTAATVDLVKFTSTGAGDYDILVAGE
jgi:hypothetical protein